MPTVKPITAVFAIIAVLALIAVAILWLTGDETGAQAAGTGVTGILIAGAAAAKQREQAAARLREAAEKTAETAKTLEEMRVFLTDNQVGAHTEAADAADKIKGMSDEEKRRRGDELLGGGRS